MLLLILLHWHPIHVTHWLVLLIKLVVSVHLLVLLLLSEWHAIGIYVYANVHMLLIIGLRSFWLAFVLLFDSSLLYALLGVLGFLLVFLSPVLLILLNLLRFFLLTCWRPLFLIELILGWLKNWVLLYHACKDFMGKITWGMTQFLNIWLQLLNKLRVLWFLCNLKCLLNNVISILVSQELIEGISQ